MDNITDRFKGSTWHDNTVCRYITIGGAGSISSWTALFLSTTNKHQLVLVDFDKVEEHNVGGQFYKLDNVGEYKTSALKRLLYEFGSISEISEFCSKIQDVEAAFDYCIAGFDNMEARKYLYEKWKRRVSRELFIDARLTAEQYEIYFVTPERQAEYEATLFDSKEAADTVCSYKTTKHFAAMCGAKIVHGLNCHLANKVIPGSYMLPFHYFEFGPTWTIQTK